MDTIEQTVIDAGGQIKRRSHNDFIAKFPGKAPTSLVSKLRGLQYHLFSSAPGQATGGTGSDYWFMRFRGTPAEWQRYLRTGKLPGGPEAQPTFRKRSPDDPIGRLFGA